MRASASWGIYHWGVFALIVGGLLIALGVLRDNDRAFDAGLTIALASGTAIGGVGAVRGGKAINTRRTARKGNGP